MELFKSLLCLVGCGCDVCVFVLCLGFDVVLGLVVMLFVLFDVLFYLIVVLRLIVLIVCVLIVVV